MAFLRIPPFPRHRAAALCAPGAAEVDADALAAALVAAQVGGAFWAPEGDPWRDGPAAHPAERAIVADLRAGGDAARAAVRAITRGWRPCDPFSGMAMGWLEAVALLAGWRAQIEANRGFAAIFGIARWKRETMDAMLWDGTGPVRYAGDAAAVPAGATALVWAARAADGVMARLTARGVRVGEIEDGFVRSAGLGANCVPPLSVICDPLGSYIDPARSNTLEAMLATGTVPAGAVRRAAGLRAALVAGGVGKYGAVAPAGASPRAAGAQRRVLVCGQVEDDRAVLLGGAGMTNARLLAAARALEPGAEVIWRPHPDVEAGHRQGAIPADDVARLADGVSRGGSIAALFTEVDAVHVISSLAGFEALLRGCAVVTHGVPFYAGWGLTRDLAAMPGRRGRPVSLDELVAAALIAYPRYLDPVTRLPCGPEVVVARMAAGAAGMVTPLVRARMAWGALRKRIGA